MTAIKFTLDGLGPFDGVIWHCSHSSGQIEFIAIPEKDYVLTQCKFIRVIIKNKSNYDAVIDRVSLEQSEYDKEHGTTSGFIYFRTVTWFLLKSHRDALSNLPLHIIQKPLLLHAGN